MDVFKTELRETKVWQDCLCDACGQTCKSTVENNECAILMANWGYGTDYDGEQHRAQICLACYKKLLQVFPISLQVESGF